MKKSFFFMSFLAAAMFAGCTKDNVVNGNRIPMTSDGTAYIAVRIASAPGTRGSDAGFEYGSENEYAVTSADFYFYDGAGAYVSQAQVWNGGDANTANPDENVEFMGNNVVMLKGLTEKTFPKYVVTVLNQPEGFTPGVTLKEMEGQIVNSFKSGERFIMTTSSYAHTTNYIDGTEQPLYFANEVVEDNFVNDPDGDVTAKPVVIYVERLAAKINLGVDSQKLVPVEGEANTYEIKASVAGDPNASPGVGSEVLRVRFDGWGLNATAKQTHIVKNIDCNWSLDGFLWNEATNFRSLWGKGTAYGKDYDADGTYGTYLNYNKLSDLTVGIGEDAYCAENTNTADRLTNMGTAATSVVIAATILHKAGANWEAADLIRYSGLLYEAADFKAYALNNLNTLGKLNYYKKAVSEESVSYVQVGVDDIEVVLNEEGNNGKVRLALTAEAKADAWVVKGATPEADTPADMAVLDNELNKFAGSGYKGGKMYYNIPVEHLYDAHSEELAEGEYGVVRNHYYRLTVNKLEKIGAGVWNPDNEELPIVPDTPDEEYYQVGVEINILSWRVVDQNVEL